MEDERLTKEQREVAMIYADILALTKEQLMGLIDRLVEGVPPKDRAEIFRAARQELP